ncbi:MAG: hypothetical protein KKA79_01635 [Nanoarchaeota archaeon]|nr:hypothetical protein [Nanoarchaeota archaeon]MCG2718445.1 hypothetical protein [Nanoarchaeota archaeon]
MASSLKKYSKSLLERILININPFYRKEYIMVGYSKPITEDEAESLIKSLDLKNELKLEREEIYGTVIFNLIHVPKGKEKHYVHYFNSLKDKTLIDYAELDTFSTLIE